jgi:hypothetical protein
VPWDHTHQSMLKLEEPLEILPARPALSVDWETEAKGGGQTPHNLPLLLHWGWGLAESTGPGRLEDGGVLLFLSFSTPS